HPCDQSLTHEETSTSQTGQQGEQELLPEQPKSDSNQQTLPPPRRDTDRALTLEDAIALAFQNQPRLRIFRAGVEQARGREESAFAPYLPVISAYSRAFMANDPNGPSGGLPLPALELGTARGSQSFALQELLLQWTLWDFGRTYGRHQQAVLSTDI